MASLMKMTTVAGRLILSQGARQAMLTSTKGAASQAMASARGFDVEESESAPQRVQEFDNVYVDQSHEELKVSLEKVISNSLQGEVLEKLGPFITRTVDKDKLPTITINHIAEEVYLRHLYMPLRKLGYHCVFTRFNGDKGTAFFQRESEEEPHVTYSYFRSDKPNIC